eukprot:COSAG02_NODE_168_length_31711_cov_68.337973_5_plen_289_part_00
MSANARGDDVRWTPRPKVNRERLLNDILNTGVNGALIGGFSLGNMQMEYSSPEWPRLDVAIYMTSFVGVHACTCACVTSAVLYRVANGLPDLAAPDWAEKNKTLLLLPIAKFGMGCVAYLCSVVLISFRDLEAISLWRYVALVIGLMSMSMTLGIAVIMGRPPSSLAVHTDPLEELPPYSRDEAGDVAKMAEMMSKIVSTLEKVATSGATGGGGASVASHSAKRMKGTLGKTNKQEQEQQEQEQQQQQQQQQQERGGSDSTNSNHHGEISGRSATTAWPAKRRRPSFS